LILHGENVARMASAGKRLRLDGVKRENSAPYLSLSLVSCPLFLAPCR
jgi:hypothetical protein